jgi:hypothetical protein
MKLEDPEQKVESSGAPVNVDLDELDKYSVVESSQLIKVRFLLTYV